MVPYEDLSNLSSTHYFIYFRTVISFKNYHHTYIARLLAALHHRHYCIFTLFRFTGTEFRYGVLVLQLTEKSLGFSIYSQNVCTFVQVGSEATRYLTISFNAARTLNILVSRGSKNN